MTEPVVEYISRPVHILAVQWWKHGDHPQDHLGQTSVDAESGFTYEIGEGRVVGPYTDEPDDRPCDRCGAAWHDHGWIETRQGGHIVHPGDYIIPELDGEGFYPCDPKMFHTRWGQVSPTGQEPTALPDTASTADTLPVASATVELVGYTESRLLRWLPTIMSGALLIVAIVIALR